MSAVLSSASSGRQAALARRRALSAGKAALPPATERLRTGDRTAALPPVVATSSVAASPSVAVVPSSAAVPMRPPREAAPSSRPVVAASAPPPVPMAAGASGRSASMMRRRQMAGGKRTLHAAAPPTSSPAAPAPDVTPAPHTAVSPEARPAGGSSVREQAKLRRALLSQRGRGEQPAAPPTRPPRQGALEYAPKVLTTTTHGGQIVTGSRIGRGTQVTGTEPGTHLPVSGTQYIGTSDGAPVRSNAPKVGLARTAGGGIVSGTLIRSKVRITGDERGGMTITGEAEQSADDDLTPRTGDSAPVAAQFNRQVDPHGHSVFGTNIGKSARSIGSRVRERAATIESTEQGLPITGSAVGRGGRVTGDEEGACRQVTGNQYLTPARAQAECGGQGGATTPAARGGAMRRDPVTGAKVSIAQTWGQQRLTGTNVEHDPRVTGEAAGSCAIITGSPYQGANTIHGWCEPGIAASAEARLLRRPAQSPITGDIPQHSDKVTGTRRGSTREVTGSAYVEAPREAPAADRPDALTALNAGFSIPSPQRSAQLRARALEEERAANAGGASNLPSTPRITGSFAMGRDRVTGNAEFLYTPRVAHDPAAAARLKITGEGRAQGTRVTGWSWSEHSQVTGTEGAIAVERNPSERSGKPQAFSGAPRFKALAKASDAKQLVTGLLGWSGKTAARVTLSGGAQA